MFIIISESSEGLSSAEITQIIIAVFTSLTALVAAISLLLNNKDRRLAYKPQFQVVDLEEKETTELFIGNFNPNYQTFEVSDVYINSRERSLSFKKVITEINNGTVFLKINISGIQDTLPSSNNLHLTLIYTSIIGVKYKESVDLDIDVHGNIVRENLIGKIAK
ncbi:hypothetical protein ACJA3J_15130 [Halobacillus sp. SY10]|uniref:hypothetical protein n=1 Tax=Halobacillus sp. SY10 TaxID=3381356 RepID=UPI00387A829E